MSDVAVATEAKQDYPYFTEEHEMIRQTVKRFCREEIAPHAEQWDHDGIFPRELFKKAADLGLFGIRIDSEWGGLGLDWWASAAYLEALVHSDSGSVDMAFMVQSEITLPVLAELGTREQKEEFLRPGVAGDAIAALGISEPGGGSDVAALKTRARIDGGDFVISGQSCGSPTAPALTSSSWPSALALKATKAFRWFYSLRKRRDFLSERNSRKSETWHPTRPSCSSTNAAFHSATCWAR